MDKILTALIKINTEQASNNLIIEGGGSWLATTIFDVDLAIRGLEISNVESCSIDMTRVVAFDISGAWLIERLLRRLNTLNIKCVVKSENNGLTEILKQISPYKDVQDDNFSKKSQISLWVEDIGVAGEKFLLNTYLMVEFLGHLAITFSKCLAAPRKFRPVSVVAVLNRVGLNAIPIVSLISFLIGVVLVYQGAFQLKKFGAEIYTVDLLAISLLREIGILMTAIMVAGRSGSAYAAQLGTMKLNQEVDALTTFGLDPMEVLVLPRIIALVIAMPLLAFIADIIGLAGGAIMSYLTLDISIEQYLQQLNQAFKPASFWVGIIKAPVFGFIIGLVGCFEGMQVRGGALSVGEKTTKAVVESIFLVVVMDALFSVIFTKLDI